MQTKGKEDNTMKQKGLRIALLFALVLSISQAVPAFAAHKLLDANSYTLTQTEQGVAISGKDGKTKREISTTSKRESEIPAGTKSTETGITFTRRRGFLPEIPRS